MLISEQIITLLHYINIFFKYDCKFFFVFFHGHENSLSRRKKKLTSMIVLTMTPSSCSRIVKSTESQEEYVEVQGPE